MNSTECSIQDTLNITEEEVSQWLYSSMETAIITVILPIDLGLCTLFNLIFLFVVFRVPETRSDTTIYLIHVAWADFLFNVSSVCFYLSTFIQSPVKGDQSISHPVQCWLLALSILTGYVTSIALVTMMSFERYLALCHPLKHLKIRGRRRTLKIAGFCWLTGLACAVLEIPATAVRQRRCVRWPDEVTYQMLPSSLSYCSPISPQVYQYTQLLILLPWFLSMFSSVYMYARIIQVLSKRREFNGRRETDRKAVQIRNQVAKMLIANGVVFFICHAPYIVLVFTIWFCRTAQIDNPLEGFVLTGGTWFMLLPQYVNTIVNPVIYGLTNREYRTAFFQAFHLKKASCTISPCQK
ncbi:pineal opsin-like [Asterias rubens]|uniref:pineal opsin-like n=1 Tax=Asterias rubens TaxID=7604 RepID=UPI001454EF51|nr:pineal opsin-like [Asterias rubens]